MFGVQSAIALCRDCRVCQVHRNGVETLFQALDGREFEVDGATCHLEVYGIWDADGHRWVQLAVDGNDRQMLTLRLREPAEPHCELVSVADQAA